MRSLTAFNLFATLTCGALGAWVYSQTQEPAPALPNAVELVALVEPASEPAAKPVFRMRPKGGFNQLVVRPPFSPSRRPPRAKPAAPPPVVQKKAPVAPKPVTEPQATLVGIVISPDKTIAMVRKPGSSELQRLAKGERLDGWLVEGVLPDRLLLSQGDKLLELELTEATKGNDRKAAAKVPVRSRRQ